MCFQHVHVGICASRQRPLKNLHTVQQTCGRRRRRRVKRAKEIDQPPLVLSRCHMRASKQAQVGVCAGAYVGPRCARAPLPTRASTRYVSQHNAIGPAMKSRWSRQLTRPQEFVGYPRSDTKALCNWFAHTVSHFSQLTWQSTYPGDARLFQLSHSIPVIIISPVQVNYCTSLIPHSLCNLNERVYSTFI